MHIDLHVILQTPPANFTYALQKGSGSNYTVDQVQHSAGKDLYFDLTIEVKGDDDLPDFKGPYVQGPKGGRFFYLGLGQYAGDHSQSGGRVKVPLTGITRAQVTEAQQTGAVLLTTIQGTAKNGGPAYATPKPFAGWQAKV
ncbi:DUF5990 family protein [Mucilaginibacter myungsuensis]|uniref:Uncharacterized protein n=1 Tax=Mucilaginibacter myungsuensis TaxID=649104 RepID=A0A929PV55_9SPHI|nr:DUF5990 family protein [Mucilaginibacter myungsuensis]MBE9661458.1 hypothetical protein [Mucilaginibacter myungsuensis]MDN3597601.1 DUF5990 family protein [Mucilaginibacter myungsuensis]